jgi:6-phosphogluconolactonase
MNSPTGPLPCCMAAMLALLVAAAHAAQLPASDAGPEKFWAYIGTYTGKGSKGIYRFDFDPATGQLTNQALAGEAANPSFLAIHPSRKYLYAVGELKSFQGKQGGAVSAFAIDPKTGDLTLLNQQSSHGDGPCHIVLDKQGKHALVANYGGGSAAVLPIDESGRLGEATCVIQHKGSGVNKQRQEGPHAHSINLDAANRFAVVADLGLDEILVYRYDAEKGTLTPNDPPAAKLAPGSGPRHFAFHPDGRHAYVINELANTVTAFDYDPERGTLKEIQTISTLPGGFKGVSYCAEVVVHPSGKFLYGSNRRQESIAIFTIDPATGKLTAAGHQAKDIKEPRNFVVDPSGKYLIVGNQNGNSLAVFRIDLKTGALEPHGEPVEAPKPVCIRFVPVPH